MRRSRLNLCNPVARGDWPPGNLAPRPLLILYRRGGPPESRPVGVALNVPSRECAEPGGRRLGYRHLLGLVGRPPQVPLEAGNRRGGGAGAAGAGAVRPAGAAGRPAGGRPRGRRAVVLDPGGRRLRVRLPGRDPEPALCAHRSGLAVRLRLPRAAGDPGGLCAGGALVALADPEVDHPRVRRAVRKDHGPARAAGARHRRHHLHGPGGGPDLHPQLPAEPVALRTLHADRRRHGLRLRLDHGGLCDHPEGRAAERGRARADGLDHLRAGRCPAGPHPGAADAGDRGLRAARWTP
jgi:hypothetical protein